LISRVHVRHDVTAQNTIKTEHQICKEVSRVSSTVFFLFRWSGRPRGPLGYNRDRVPEVPGEVARGRRDPRLPSPDPTGIALRPGPETGPLGRATRSALPPQIAAPRRAALRLGRRGSSVTGSGPRPNVPTQVPGRQRPTHQHRPSVASRDRAELSHGTSSRGQRREVGSC